jgi:hypothetical protein
MTMRTMIAILALAGCHAAGAAKNSELAWQPPTEIAKGGGTKGPWQQNNSKFDYVDDPSVALGTDGSAAVVWVDHRNKDVHFQRFARDGKPQSRAVNVSRSPEVFSWLPRIVMAKQDVVVLWQEIVFSGGSHGGEIFVARSTDGGNSFAEPVNLTNSIGGEGKGRINAKVWHNGSLDLALAPDGTVHAAWTEYDGPLWLASSRNGGSSFGKPQQIAGDKARPARAPTLAIAGDGTIALAWTYGEDDAADIHFATRAPRADAFSKPRPLVRTMTYSDAPKLAFDRAGTLHAAYVETSGGPFDRPRVLYMRSTDRGATFERAKTLADQASYPALETDGNVVAVLWDVIDDEGQPRGLGLAVSRNRGGAFATTKLVPNSRDAAGGTNGSHQGHLMNKLAVRGSDIAVMNASLTAGKGSRVWMMRGRTSGAEAQAKR